MAVWKARVGRPGRMAAAVAVCIAALSGVALAKPECEECKKLTDKFATQMENTKGRSSGAGNTNWEETRGIKWDTSEARLTEILEAVCGKSDGKCNAMLEEAEEFIELWWARRKLGKAKASLHSYVCVMKLKICCEAGTFGKDCKECPGGATSPCSNHGECQGAGDRKGKGKCKCEAGYIGKRCAKCGKLHYKELGGDSGNFTCSKCDVSCAKGCSGAGSANCQACAAGYEMKDTGCTDIDECEVGNVTGAADGDERVPACSGSTYCANTPGSFECKPCSAACDPASGCTGAGATDCVDNKCSSGYTLVNDECTDVDECQKDDTCPTGFCTNTLGSFTCGDCHEACNDAGCTNGAASGCRGCNEGWIMPEGRELGCDDVDECEDANRCEEGFSCMNKPGTFTCYCQEPRQLVDGKCVSYAEAPDAKDESDPKDEL